MKKKMSSGFRRAAALVLGLALALSMSIPAFAAQVIINTEYEPVKGDSSHGFKQFLIIDEQASVPDIEYEYSIAPGQAVPATRTSMEVLSGVGSPSVGKAVFVQGEETSSYAEEGLVLDSMQKYAVKTVNFDFSQVEFKEPGIYRYIVTMTSADQQAVDYDVQRGAQAAAKKRVLDVYVIDENGALKIDSYVFHELEDQVPAGAQGGSASVSEQHARLADKSDGFVNLYATQYLEFGKQVTGNQGAKDKYFAFTLKITGAAPQTTYDAHLGLAEMTSRNTAATKPEYRDKQNPYEFTTDSSGAATLSFYLCSEQYVIISGLPRGCSYALSEDAEDYVSTEGISAEHAWDKTAHTDPVSGTVASSDIRTGFTNTRNGIVPTGVMMSAAPAAGVFAAGGAGFAAVLALKRRKDRNDENA